MLLHTIDSPQADQLETGRFYYPNGTVYDGQYKVLGLPPPVAPEPAKKGAKKKEDELPAAPAEPPKPVRHGKGSFELQLLLSIEQ